MCKKHSIKLLIFTLLISGCRYSDKQQNSASDDRNKSEPIQIFIAELDKSKVLRFSSRGGMVQGLDSDEVLVFQKEGKVELEELSFSPTEYFGNFTIKNNTISIELNGYKKEWPLMRVTIDQGEIFLYRASSEVPEEEMDPESSFYRYWPFGIVEGKY